MNKIRKNIPNMITISRMISCIIAPILLSLGNISGAVGLYIYGAISDCLDGFAARKLNAFTKLGKILDPISDKLYAASLLISAMLLGNYLMIIPMILEGEITATNIAAKKSGILIETERVGKYKTVLLFISLILGLLAPLIPSIYFLLAPSLLYTAHFQIQSIHAYENQYHNKLLKKYENNLEETKVNNNQNNITKSNEKQSITKQLKNQVLDHYYEFQFYKNLPIESKTKTKSKKLKRTLKK